MKTRYNTPMIVRVNKNPLEVLRTPFFKRKVFHPQRNLLWVAGDDKNPLEVLRGEVVETLKGCLRLQEALASWRFPLHKNINT